MKILFLMFVLIISFSLSSCGVQKKLTSYKEYSGESELSITFSYEKPENKDLKKLREKYNLDSIAGNVDEINQLKNLVKWAHNIVPHSINPITPKRRSSQEIIDYILENQRGVNCSSLGIILNDAYLSMGFKSKVLVCTPAKKNYKENHIVVAVFSNTLQKWIFMDPTWEAWFEDEKGKLQSPSEIRYKLANKETMVVNPGLNYNGKKRMSERMYKWYMTKNMFRMASPVESEPGYESTDKVKKWIVLLPKKYVNYQMPKYLQEGEYIIHFTNNESIFWQRP